LNNIQSGNLIYKSESIAILEWEILEYGLEHSKAMSTGRITQECDVGIGTGMGTGTKL